MLQGDRDVVDLEGSEDEMTEIRALCIFAGAGGCLEDARQSLPMLLDGTLPGAPFDAAAEREAYSAVAANIGTCGETVYEHIKKVLIEKGSH